MNHLDIFIVDLALIMAAAGVVTIVFKRFRLPVVLGYILAGFLISPHFVWLPTVVEMDNIETWGNIGIVFLMFGLGLEFSFKKLKNVGHAAIVTALIVICGMVPSGFLVGRLLGWSTMNSIFLGCVISMSSTMVILKAYEEYHLKKKQFAGIVLGALVIEDILGIFMMIVLTTISVSRNADGGDLAVRLGTLLIYLAAWMVLGILLIPTLLRKTRKLLNDETLVILSIAICLAMVVIAHWIGFSEALGAFLGGSILAGTISAERIERLIKPIKDMFGAVFFVSVGMMIVPSMLVKYWVPILIISVVTIIGQMMFATIGILVSGQTMRTAVHGGMSMVQIGEFSFIVATLGNNLDVTGEFLFPIVVCVSVITIMLTPVFMKNSQRVYMWLYKMVPERLHSVLKKYTKDSEDVQETSDWMLFLKRYAVRTLITSMMLFIVYQLGTRKILPFMTDKFDDPANLMMTAIVTVVLMIPFISLMWYDRSSLFKKLWLISSYNRLPLIALRVARMTIAVFMLAMVLGRILHASLLVLIPLSILLVLIIIRSEYMRGRSIKMEMRFMTNINERVLHKHKMERTDDKKWLGKSLYVVEFGLTDPGFCTTVRMMHETRMADARIIKIVRNGKTGQGASEPGSEDGGVKEKEEERSYVNMPGPDEQICTGDVITAMGRKDKLENYLLLLEQDEHIGTPDDEPVTLREYVYGEVFRKIPAEEQIMLCAIPVEKETGFAGRSIRNSTFKETYGGFVIGLERGDLSIPDPHIDVVLEAGDVIWAIGDQDMADKLLADGLLDDIEI